MNDQNQPFGWQPMATAPRDGTQVDLWSTEVERRVTNVRFIRAAEVNDRYAPGGVWEHLGQDGWRTSRTDDAILLESQYSHWRLTALDRPTETVS